MLVGRAAERQAIGRLLAAARLRTSGALVVSGEPGAGKSALLDDADLDGFRVLRATGVESEQELPFAGLLQLVRPALGCLDELPAQQAAVLAAALALGDPAAGDDGGTRDRFMLGAAVLSLVCRYAESGPVAVVVDDLQALDRPSAETIVFTARRLSDDPVAVLLAGRSPVAEEVAAGLPVLRIDGLGPADAAVLLEQVADARPPAERLAALMRATGGNPLALRELAHAPDAELLVDGAEDLPLQVPERVVMAFGRQLARLGDGCRTVLLVAAVTAGELRLTAEVAKRIGVDVDALSEAESAGLVTVGRDAVRFRHPLVRAAAYARAPMATRRTVHRAVAATLPDGDLARRAWHLAEATWHPDHEVSALVAAAAQDAEARLAYAVASVGYERSARLSPDLHLRCAGLRHAAETAWAAGLGDRARSLLDEHARCRPDADATARELALRGTIAARGGALRTSVELLTEAADLAGDPTQQALALVDAVQAAFHLGDAGAAAGLGARLTRLLPTVSDGGVQALALVATGMARVLAGDGGIPELRRAVTLLEERGGSGDPRRLGWLLMAPLFLRDGSGRRLGALVDRLRHEGGVGALPGTLFLIARDQATSASWPEAVANYSEGVRLAADTGQVTDQAACLAGLTWVRARQGNETECRRHAAETLALCAGRELYLAEAWVLFALGDLELSLGAAGAAVARFRELTALLDRRGLADVDLVPGPELVDALLRTGERAGAEQAATSYAAAAATKGQPWARARAARARGLLAADDAFDACFEEARRLHEQTPDSFESARTRLAHGERLRRAGRRVDARVQLRQALADLESLGAARWADRAAAELAATGETARRRDADPRDALTPQELQVCLLLAEGRTTRETAAALFLSPKTVEYHLRKVYARLGIRSRDELARLLEGSGETRVTQD